MFFPLKKNVERIKLKDMSKRVTKNGMLVDGVGRDGAELAILAWDEEERKKVEWGEREALPYRRVTRLIGGGCICSRLGS